MNLVKSFTHRAKPILEDFYLATVALGKNNLFTQLKKGPKVTIFGCCRQDSIYKYFDVTGVRNGLTYPHYSKEVIQAIEYCKFADSAVPEWAFRNPQINLKLKSKRSLMKEFSSTDVFIVEIASRLEYKYKDAYLHHEIFDNPARELKKDWPSKSQISVREQSLEELRQDLEKIVDLLEGKEVIFACHISTRDYGKRASLVSEIRNFCEKRQIKCFVPSDLLKFYEERDIFVDELVLSHFTDLGHRIAGYRYRELIETRVPDSSFAFNPLVQTLERPTLNQKEFSPGFGDFLNGSLKVYEIARRLNRIPKIDLSNSLFSHHLENRYAHQEESPLSYIYHEDSDVNFVKSTRVFTNKVSQSAITDEQKDFIFRNCLTPKPSLESKIREVAKNLDLTENGYEVLHVRVSDDFDKSPDIKLLGQISKLVKDRDFDKGEPFLFLSNSNVVRNSLSSMGFVSPHQEVRHSSDPKATTEAIENTLIEFFLISRASKIYQISTYEWGSGFSTLAAKLFDKSIERLEIGRT